MRRIVNAAEGLIHNPIGSPNMTYDASHIAELDEWSKPNVIECTATEAPQIRKRFDGSVSANRGAAVRSVSVPNDHVGKLLDHGTSSAYAIHLLGHKIGRFNGPGLALNEDQVSKPVAEGGIAMGERRFQKGLAVMRGQEILDRRKGGRLPNRKRAFARETLAKGGDRYVSLPEILVRSSDSKLVAFVAAVLLARLPQDARDVAKRIGVSPKSPNTINKLVKRALACQYIAGERVGHRWIVARPGVNLAGFKNVAVQNVAVQNVANHRLLEDDQRRLRTEAQETERESLPQDMRAHERAAALVENLNEDTTKWIILSDWKQSSYFKSRLHDWSGLSWMTGRPLGMTLSAWRYWLDRFGGAPGHLGTPATLMQANEAAHLIHLHSKSCSVGDVSANRALIGLAFALCHAAARGSNIRSLSFVVQRLLRLTDNDDLSWAYNFPTSLPDAEFAEAFAVATSAVDRLEAGKFPFIRRDLLGTDGIEAIASRIKHYSGATAIKAGVILCSSSGRKPADGALVIGWSYFDQEFEQCSGGSVSRQRPLPSQPAGTNKADWQTNHAASRAQHIAAREARLAEVKKVADAAIALLCERGKEADTHRLQIRSQLDDLSSRLVRSAEPIEVLQASVLRWLSSNPERKTVTAWSNIGWAIRDELAARQQRTT
jgi:hypothetical protein